MIIALSGLKGAGKDSVADVLEREHGFQKFSFASILKDAVAAIFGWDRDLLDGGSEISRVWREREDRWWAERLNKPGLTPRSVLQEIGTEVLRAWNEDIWIAAAERRLARWLADPNTKGIVLTDCRFPNEMAMVRSLGGRVVRVCRGEDPEWFRRYREEGRIPSAEEAHVSEWAWAREPADAILHNTGPLSEIPGRVARLLEWLR